MRNPKHILVPVDGSVGSDHAAALAASFAVAFDAKVTLLHIVAPTSTAETLGLAGMERPQVEQHIAMMAKPHLEQGRAAFASAETGIHATEVHEFGFPPLEIVGYAQTHEVDLIVMGSRGLSPLRELLLGSVSETVMRRAPCPVTVVR